MSIRISAPAKNLREELNDLRNQSSYAQQQFWFTGDGSTTDFALPNGWKPLHVFNAGALQKEGSGDDYTVSSGTVSFNVAPTNGNDIGVIGVYA